MDFRNGEEDLATVADSLVNIKHVLLGLKCQKLFHLNINMNQVEVKAQASSLKFSNNSQTTIYVVIMLHH